MSIDLYGRKDMEECIFCKIRRGELPSTKLYEDDDFIIIKDINPVAKIHLIVLNLFLVVLPFH